MNCTISLNFSRLTCDPQIRTGVFASLPGRDTKKKKKFVNPDISRKVVYTIEPVGLLTYAKKTPRLITGLYKSILHHSRSFRRNGCSPQCPQGPTCARKGLVTPATSKTLCVRKKPILGPFSFADFVTFFGTFENPLGDP
jgi:hypothetical protein